MGTLHALTLLTCIALTELACSRLTMKPSGRRIVGSIVAAVGLALFAASLGLHMCDRGAPVQQWLIPSICLGFALTRVGHTAVRRWLTAMLSMIAIVGSLHYARLVHGDTYLGRPTAAHDTSVPHAVWHTPLTGLYRLR